MKIIKELSFEPDHMTAARLENGVTVFAHPNGVGIGSDLFGDVHSFAGCNARSTSIDAPSARTVALLFKDRRFRNAPKRRCAKESTQDPATGQLFAGSLRRSGEEAKRRHCCGRENRRFREGRKAGRQAGRLVPVSGSIRRRSAIPSATKIDSSPCPQLTSSTSIVPNLFSIYTIRIMSLLNLDSLLRLRE